MKIAKVVCSFPPYRGGIGNVAYYETRELKAKGHELAVFTIGDNIQGERQTTEVFYLKAWLKLGKAAWLPQLLFKLKKFDVVILHYPFFGAQEVVWLAKKLGLIKKLIIFYHMDFSARNFLTKILSWPSKIIFSSLIKQADRVSVSTIDYVEQTELKKFINDKVVELAFGVDLSTEIYSQKEEKIILFVGAMDRAHYFKGIDLLLKAFKQVSEKHGDWQLHLVGDGDLRNEYEKKMQVLGLGKQVVFCGRLDDETVNEKRKSSAFGVLPSINSSEAFGLVLLEMMACGRPVIASDLPGVRQVCVDGQTGLVVKAGDDRDLAEKMLKLIEDGELREKLGQQARKTVEQKFTWQKHGEKLNEILLEIRN